MNELKKGELGFIPICVREIFSDFGLAIPNSGIYAGIFEYIILIPSEFQDQVKYDEIVKVPEVFEITPFILSNYQFFNENYDLVKRRFGRISNRLGAHQVGAINLVHIKLVQRNIFFA